MGPEERRFDCFFDFLAVKTANLIVPKPLARKASSSIFDLDAESPVSVFSGNSERYSS